MRKTSLTAVVVCATLLWVGAAHAKKPPPLTCAQRQIQDVDELTSELTAGQALCTADLTTHGCDANVCLPQAFPATGQTTSYAPGDDGAIKAGAALSYTDNGDGTITDNNTKLMWEKKSNGDGSLHDENYTYPWAGSCSDNVTLCQTDADCGAATPCRVTDGQGTGLTIFQWVAQLNAAEFAGHTDWRIPNVKELQSIVDYQNPNPSVEAAFNTNCSTECTVTTCSCTQTNFYWSSTTNADVPSAAWPVGFGNGAVFILTKAGLDYVRAVRGGL
jgi:hypothetical protein